MTIAPITIAVAVAVLLLWLLFFAPDRYVAPFGPWAVRTTEAVAVWLDRRLTALRRARRRVMVWLADRALGRYMEPDQFIALLKRDMWRHALIQCMTLEDRLGLARNLLRGYFTSADVQTVAAAAMGQRNVAHQLHLRGKKEESDQWREGARDAELLLRRLARLLSDADYAAITGQLQAGLGEPTAPPGLVERVTS
jgi:hypothetical protein